MNWKHNGPSEPPRNRLYRNTQDGVIAGVCAGLADYFGFDLTLTRILVVAGAIFFSPFVFIVYIILALVLERKPRYTRDRQREDVELERRVRSEPHATLHSVRHRFRELDRRLQRMEKYVTSDRFNLDREFEGLRD